MKPWMFIHSLINSLTCLFEWWIFTPLDQKIHDKTTLLVSSVFILRFRDCFLKIPLFSIIVTNKIDFVRYVLLISAMKMFPSIEISTSKTPLFHTTYNTWLLTGCKQLRVFKMVISYWNGMKRVEKETIQVSKLKIQLNIDFCSKRWTTSKIQILKWVSNELCWVLMNYIIHNRTFATLLCNKW